MIQNLLFDLGGVILDIKRENCVAALTRLGMAGADELLDPYTQRGPFLLLESGQISAEEFRDRIRQMLADPDITTDDEIEAAFNEFLIGIPLHRLRALEQLRKRYGIYMLSNTNPIMWKSKIAAEFCKDGSSMQSYFDGILTSFEAGCVKPSPRIFDIAAERFGFDRATTLFLDDGPANVEAARECGYQAALVPPGTEFIDLIP